MYYICSKSLTKCSSSALKLSELRYYSVMVKESQGVKCAIKEGFTEMVT